MDKFKAKLRKVCIKSFAGVVAHLNKLFIGANCTNANNFLDKFSYWRSLEMAEIKAFGDV